MKSSDDELNDAIKNALKGSIGNFERKPKASLDDRIYRELGQKPNRKPLWAALSLVALLGLTVWWYVNDNKNHLAINKTKPETGNIEQKALPYQEKENMGVRETTVKTAAKTTLDPSLETPHTLSENRIIVTRKAEIAFENQSVSSQSKSSVSEPNTGPEGRHNDVAEDKAVTGKSDNIDNVFKVNELDFLNALNYPTLPLPLITVPMYASEKASAAQDVADKKPVNSWKPAMLVNVSATNTSQSVYLLPSAHSRILKVSFPNSIANVGYKIGFGMQANGYQLLINYSHLQYQTEYVYALDEFSAEPANASYRFKRLGAARTVKSAFDIIGVAAKKNIDFETKALGALYAQLGMDYSRSVMGPDQQLLSASVSAGKRIFTGPKATIVIGPFFEYNILRILTSEENVKIRPNQVGISLGLKFTN
ncbi:hypothetical protein [Dyadobacter fanqingshengii]|uniref:Uncharacterized protein n=1 Tax=Dyadobacter fanqingshengii TaxID=2906443 RepID=A0A9X1TGU4_9BACT|nr:hypothetical protein [Dyadobacter fanqingshengii]MCF0040852.1 hypothetical protein [Dyadobacter fanqingshengii]USJ37415.1 hypothetical protein NFI81_06445 [Dyadobacter fanqingshengii]